MLKESSKKIKVLHVVGGMQAGGLETLIMNIYRNIDRSNIHFDFAVQTDTECYYDEEIIRMGGKIFSHPKPQKNLKEFKNTLENTIKNNGPYDAIHSHVIFFSGVILDVSKKCGVPVRIAHSHNTSDSKKDTLYRKLYRKYMQLKILKSSTHLIGCSKEACEYVFGKGAYESGKASHFPNSIDLKKYTNLEKDKSYLLKELNLKEDSILIGHIGRFTKQKNHPFLIEIFEDYAKKEKRAHLILVGEGKDEETIKNLIKQKKMEKRVHFLGLRNDIPHILGSLDLFLFPSLYEGLGIVIVESQAAGTPCLISKNIPYEADLDIGLVSKLDINTDDINIWSNKISYLINTDHISWSTRESALRKKKYDIKVSAKKMFEIYSN